LAIGAHMASAPKRLRKPRPVTAQPTMRSAISSTA
jgi:hypothetical protein